MEMFIGVCIIATYIYYLHNKITELEKELKDVKELKHKEIENYFNRYSYQTNNKITENVNQILSKLRETQYEIYFSLHGNYLKEDDNLISNSKDLLNESLNKLFQTQKKISDKYKLLQEKIEIAQKVMISNINEYPFIATVIADYETAKEKAIIQYLRNKSRPAYSAAEIVAEIKREKKKGFEQLYAYKWELAYLHDLLPWLEEIEYEATNSITKQEEKILDVKEDGVVKWVSLDEYRSLSITERNQLALDRYMKSNKSKWQIGRDYERYIGYLYEIKGFKVTYFGIEQGLEDLGRDLICYKENEIHIVQCKCWSSKKEIHEKHINQLFGTTVMYYFSELNPRGTLNEFYNYMKKGKIIPVFVTTTKFSKTAIKFAESLNVLHLTVPLEDYPMIKCNINRTTGEKIYHLPFDQQYDKCIISPKDGEFYAKTVKEAESKGFRRAMKWYGI